MGTVEERRKELINEAYLGVLKVFVAKSEMGMKTQMLLSKMRQQMGIDPDTHERIFRQVKQATDSLASTASRIAPVPSPVLNDLPQAPPRVPISTYKIEPATLPPPPMHVALPVPAPPVLPPSMKAGAPKLAGGKGPSMGKGPAMKAKAGSAPGSLSEAAPAASGKLAATKKRKSGTNASSSSMYPPGVPALIGRKVKRNWPENGGWYEGVITNYNRSKDEYCITYDINKADMESYEWFAVSLSSPNECQLLDERVNLLSAQYANSKAVKNSRVLKLCKTKGGALKKRKSSGTQEEKEEDEDDLEDDL